MAPKNYSYSIEEFFSGYLKNHNEAEQSENNGEPQRAGRRRRQQQQQQQQLGAASMDS